MAKIIFITLVFSSLSHALDYDVSNFSRNGYEMYEITVNGCRTMFSFNKKEHEKLVNDNEMLSKMVKIAIENAKQGCK